MITHTMLVVVHVHVQYIMYIIIVAFLASMSCNCLKEMEALVIQCMWSHVHCSWHVHFYIVYTCMYIQLLNFIQYSML